MLYFLLASGINQAARTAGAKSGPAVPLARASGQPLRPGPLRQGSQLPAPTGGLLRRCVRAASCRWPCQRLSDLASSAPVVISIAQYYSTSMPQVDRRLAPILAAYFGAHGQSPDSQRAGAVCKHAVVREDRQRMKVSSLSLPLALDDVHEANASELRLLCAQKHV